MKKHFKLLSRSISLSVVSTTMISSGLILSSCVNKKDDSEDNNETPSSEIIIEDQSSDTHEVDSGEGLTLYVNVKSDRPVNYQWYVDKNNNSGWTLIKDATESSYIISNDLTQNVITTTTWKYKVEIYDADNTNIKIISNIYSVNIKPQSIVPDPSPNPEPNPSPNPSPNPNPTPPTNPDSNPSNSINLNSIELKNYKQLLPSQYLSNLTNPTLDKALIVENFDTKKITDVSYAINALDDKAGTLSLLMKYKEDNANKSYEFNFTNLLKLDDIGYQFEFTNATDILNLNAQDVAEKKLDSKSNFESFVSDLENFNIKFKFKNKGNELPLTYLDFSSVNITGFSTNWFTNNKKISLTFNFQNPKINYYVKTTGNSISLKKFEYPSNIDKKAIMEFYSASDYFLNQITSNNKYKSDKYAAYYYYDIINDNAKESQLKISNNDWLSNVKNYIDYKGKNYAFKPILDINSVSSENGSLTINLSMEYQDNGSSNVKSLTSKNITINGFISYDQTNLFSNSSDNINGKFSLGCEAKNYDDNIKRLKWKKDLIIKEIEKMTNSQTSITFNKNQISPEIIKILKASLNCKFSGIELIYDENKNYYYNDLTAIDMYYVDYNNTFLRYNKQENVFQLVVKDFSITGVGVDKDNYVENPNEMIVNITHPGQSLQKLKDLN